MKKKPRITVKSGKARGRKFQQWTANEISKVIGIPCGKDLDIESRPGGQSGTDIILRGRAKELFPFAIENKNQEKWSVHEWIKQAKSNAEGNNWLLFCKRNHMKPIVVLDADKFFEIIGEVLWWRTGKR